MTGEVSGRWGVRQLQRMLAAIAFWGGLTGGALAQGTAMVTDVAGRVHSATPITIMSDLPLNAGVRLEAGASLVVLYAQSGEEYSFSGPAEVRFGPGVPQVLAGAQPRKRVNPIARASGVTIRPVGVQQAAFVMRSARPTARIQLLTLSGSKTLEPAPEFRWKEIRPGLTYRLELTDDTGRSLHVAQVDGDSFRLPAEIRLRESVTYTWELSTRTPDGRRYVTSGDFTVATEQLRTDAESLRPAEGAPVSDRVAYAAWLDSAELKDEARKYWAALAAERPDDARLKALAGE